MKLYFAGDHAGFEMKQKLMEFVRGLGHEIEDLGPLEPKAGDDYPDYVIPLARQVVKGETGERGEKGGEVRGIVVAGSGQGEIIAMNRIKGARAALMCPGPQMIPLIIASRDHNDSNIFAIGARFCTLDEAKKGITVWLETPFSNAERHIRRLQKNDVYGS
ncbi:MAG: RpiB/LacA/LacB family sugar-phosphate isomerase [bacterium]|nr:RpiB/LacA/LacB family sugar-phosphate isomerase [bacterium]